MDSHTLKVLTTIPGKAGRFWGDNTTLISDKCREIMYGPRNGTLHRQLKAFTVAFQMFLKRKNFSVIVVDSGPVGQWFSWLQSLFAINKSPTLMIDCLWYRHDNKLVQGIKRLLKKLTARSVSLFVVWARHEVEDYSREFRIPKQKFLYVPFHATIDDYEFDISDEGVIFAGGNGDRDYRTLIEAVRGLDMLLFIAATDKRLFEGIEIPPNVMVNGLSHEEFRQKMASCRIAVVPMQGGLLHSGGQQTFLNSMYMGKPTIIVGPKAADGYIESGVNGSVVDYGDVTGLRKAIVSLYNDSDLRNKIGEAGRSFTASLTTDQFVRRLFSVAENLSKCGRSAPQY